MLCVTFRRFQARNHASRGPCGTPDGCTGPRRARRGLAKTGATGRGPEARRRHGRRRRFVRRLGHFGRPSMRVRRRANLCARAGPARLAQTSAWSGAARPTTRRAKDGVARAPRGTPFSYTGRRPSADASAALTSICSALRPLSARCSTRFRRPLARSLLAASGRSFSLGEDVCC